MKSSTALKLCFFLVLVCFAVCASSQANAKVDAQGNYVPVAAPKTKDEGKPTGKNFSLPNGETFPVYESVKGKLFVKRKSKDSGKEYKYYIKLS